MTRPRVFVSSTFYDLKHIRSSLDNFIESLGFDAMLSEKGSVAYAPDIALDESCYREAQNADIFVLIIGGRYGSAASEEPKINGKRDFYSQYESITKKEYETAVEQTLPIFILIESAVYAEYQTYLANKSNGEVLYAHVDSVNVFKFIEEILSKPRNNPIQRFERFADIEIWLREQWAGLFRELLRRVTSQQQLTTLSAQVESLRSIGGTLQQYLETLVHRAAPDEAPKLIADAKEREEKTDALIWIRANDFYDKFVRPFPAPRLQRLLKESNSVPELLAMMRDTGGRRDLIELIEAMWRAGDANELDELRSIVRMPPYPAAGE